MDAPPVLGIPETRVLTRLADGVVLVLRAKVSSVEDALEAERQIIQDGGKLLGTVLNHVPARMLPYYSPRKTYSLNR